MISAFKLIGLSTILLFINCIVDLPQNEPDAFTKEAQVFVDRIMDENPGASYDINIIDVSAGFGFSRPAAYMLGIIVTNEVVLTNTIDSLRLNGIYRFNKSGYGTGNVMVNLPFKGIQVKCDTLDSILIITDSIIAFEKLDLRWCNLTHLPPEIGKIRTGTLDISWNKGLTLPKEITQMDSLPQPYTSLDVNSDQTWTNETFDTLPDWAKEWLGKHNL